MNAQIPTVLVGVDESERGDDATALAASLAAALGARVLVANVRPMVLQPWMPGSDALKANLLEASRRVLDAARDRVVAAGVTDADTRSVAESSVPRALSRLAAEVDARVIVVAQTHHGRGRRIAGVAERLVHASPCAVAIAPPGLGGQTGSLERISVAFDTSEEAVAALRQAIALAQRSGASLEVSGVVDPIAVLWGGADVAGYFDDVRKALGGQLREEIEKALDGFPARVRVFDGSIGDSLLKASADADLLVCGSRGYGPLGAVVLGSVSNRLAHTATCPVLAIPGTSRPLVETDAAPAGGVSGA